METGNLVRCHQCQGRKKYTALGHIERTCEPCSGVGFIAAKFVVEVLDVPSLDLSVTPIPVEPEATSKPDIKTSKLTNTDVQAILKSRRGRRERRV